VACDDVANKLKTIENSQQAPTRRQSTPVKWTLWDQEGFIAALPTCASIYRTSLFTNKIYLGRVLLVSTKPQKERIPSCSALP
jgi:hypothetical protein